MRRFYLYLMVCILLGGVTARCDDYKYIAVNCGPPNSDAIEDPLHDGTIMRTLTYESGGEMAMVQFFAKSNKGPWNNPTATFNPNRFPCLAAAGIKNGTNQKNPQERLWNEVANNMESIGIGTYLFVPLLFIAAIAYFIPIAVVVKRRSKAAAGIAIINIFLGWTFVGWVIALAWAASGEKAPPKLRTA